MKRDNESMTLTRTNILLAAFLVAAITSLASQLLASEYDGKDGSKDGDTQVSISEAVEKSLGYLAEQGQAWIDEKDCASCHRVGNLLWTMAVAKNYGYPVDERHEEWQSWTYDSLMIEEDGVRIGDKNRSGVAQLLIADRIDPFLSSRQIEDLVGIIVQGQDPSGTWAPGGQLPSQKRPKSETRDVTTSWLALGLLAARLPPSEVEEEECEVAESKPALRALAEASVRRAREALANRSEALSTEWYVTQLKLSLASEQEEQAQRWARKLVDLQHKDGGWGWLHADPSDALGTGMALAAICELRKKTMGNEELAVALQQSIEEGMEFLLRTQEENGSWRVKGTKAKKKDGFEETAEYWGTAWATLALVKAEELGKP